jgi:hypothetical protein
LSSSTTICRGVSASMVVAVDSGRMIGIAR